jgi:predicted ABC-type ATPase
MVAKKRIIVIAGPNGAGKTTFAREFLPNEAGCPNFINADLIAAGLSPFRPETVALRAGRLMLQAIDENVRTGRSFSFETTLSSARYGRLIPHWRELGYRIELIFLSLPDVRVAIERVRSRVRRGGHDVPVEVIRRRFDRGMKQFVQKYKKLVDRWALFDNSGDKPRLIEKS